MSDPMTSMGANPAEAPQTTIDHDKIRGWAEARRGVPAHSTSGKLARSDPRTLRIRFLGDGRPGQIEPIQWREWFQRFDELHLAFVFEERTPDGQPSKVSKLIRRREDGGH